MQDIQLGTSGLRAPQLGFGCSALMGRSGRTASLRALAAAWDEGIRFFDTARSYGYGESEALLGEFLQGRRSDAIIATKFGILADRQSSWKRTAKAVARSIITVVPSARSMIQRGAASQFTHNQFTIPILQQSIEESLRKLRTDSVDMLFMHAAPASVLEQDDLLEAIGQLITAGKVKVAGLSAEPEVVALATEQKTRLLKAMQFPCNVFNISSAVDIARRTGDSYTWVANNPYGGVARVKRCREILLEIVQSQKLDQILCEKLGSLEDTIFADIVLNVILRESGIHVVIPAMMRVDHIRANVQALSHSRFTTNEITHIRRALTNSVA